MVLHHCLQRGISFLQKIFLIIFGIILGILLIEAGLRLGELVFLSFRESRNRISMMEKDVYRIMCIGESTTFCGGNKDSYPSQLEEILNQKNIGIKFSVINKGSPAKDTTFILDQLEGWLNTYKPDMVIAMMGINDGGSISFEPLVKKKAFCSISDLRFFKLIQLLRVHIAQKIQELKIYWQRYEDNNSFKMVKSEVLKNYSMLETTVLAHETDTKNRLEELSVKQTKHMFPEEKSVNAIKLMPKKFTIYLEKGLLYFDQAKYDEAERLFKEAIEIDHKDWRGYYELGRTLMMLKRFYEADNSYNQAIKLNPNNKAIYATWGWMSYLEQGYDQGIRKMKRAIDIDPRNNYAYYTLGRIYQESKEYVKSEQMYKEALRLDPTNDRAQGGVITVCIAMKKYQDAEYYYRLINKLRFEYFNPIMHRNYQKLKDIVDKRGIKLVCVQYPMRNSELLKSIFAKYEGIIFVDNDKIFKQAVQNSGYEDYFVDMFAGDFGHCTRKGYRLLANNIANVILKEAFGK